MLLQLVLLGWATQAQQLARKDSSMLYYIAAIVAGSINLAEGVILEPQARAASARAWPSSRRGRSWISSARGGRTPTRRRRGCSGWPCGARNRPSDRTAAVFVPTYGIMAGGHPVSRVSCCATVLDVRLLFRFASLPLRFAACWGLSVLRSRGRFFSESVRVEGVEG